MKTNFIFRMILGTLALCLIACGLDAAVDAVSFDSFAAVGHTIDAFELKPALTGFGVGVLPFFLDPGGPGEGGGAPAEFKELSDEEVGKLDEKGKADYFVGLVGHMNSQLKAANDQLTQLKAKETIDEDAVKAIIKDINGLKDAKLTELQKALEAQGEVVQILKEGQEPKLDEKTMRGMVRKALEDNWEDISAMKGGRGSATLEVKAPALITVGTNITGPDAGLLPQFEYTPGIKLIPERNPFLTQLITVRPTSNAQITWTEEANPEGDAEFVLEGGLKPLVDFEIQPKKSAAKEVAVRAKASKWVLEDIDEMEDAIMRKMMKRHDLKLEVGILRGDMTANPEEFDGIITVAPAFVAGSFAAAVVNANNADVLKIAANQVFVASDGEFLPNVALVHPDDLCSMKLEKTTDGAYIFPAFNMPGGNEQLAGMVVIPKTQMNPGEFLVGQMDLATHRPYVGFELEFGWENDDFSKNLVSMRASSRSHFYIQDNCKTGFVTGDFAVAKAAIDKP